ncbi:MAG: polyprenyl synthetase family protein [Planctomycetota bacterium]
MNKQATQMVSELAPRIEHALLEHLPISKLAGARVLNQAVRYSVFSGGKRMRPVLTVIAAKLTGLSRDDSLKIAAALEYLHTASLILDDLPCMDDTTERRGKVSTHIQFGEGVAVLAAMSLLNQTYALLADLPNGQALVRLACECIGHLGMVAGQTIDLVANAGSRADQREEHYLKTTALFRLALVAPSVAAGSPPEVVEALSGFGHCAGMGYQLVDDAHDLEDDRAWEGLSASQMHERAADWIKRAKAHVTDGFSDTRETGFLVSFADWLLAGAQTPAAK